MLHTVITVIQNLLLFIKFVIEKNKLNWLNSVDLIKIN